MTSPEQWTDERFRFALAFLEEATDLCRTLQTRTIDPHQKSDNSPVTVTDLAVQAVFGRRLSQAYPYDRLIAEETPEQLQGDPNLLSEVAQVLALTNEEVLNAFSPAHDQTDGFCWILDPVDGTKGFLRGHHFAIALAGHQPLGEAQFGLLGCPRLGESGVEPGPGVIAAAYRGAGAWQRVVGSSQWHSISVGPSKTASQIRLLRSYEASHTNESQLEHFVQENGIEAPPVRLDSQAKYVLLARGDAEAVIRCLSPSRPNYREKIWDQAAGAIVVEEAGGSITDLLGRKLDLSLGAELQKNVGVVAHNGSLKGLDWSPLRPTSLAVEG